MMSGLNEKQKNRVAFAVAVIFIIILLITGTVSWLRIRAMASKVNVVKASSLYLILDESATNGIKLENDIPKSYRQGLLNTKYTFTLKNNSTIDTKYTITLVDDYTGTDEGATNIISDDLIRYVLVKNGNGLDPANSKLLSEGRTIDTDVISGMSNSTPTETTYDLYIWIDSKAGDDATEADIMNKIFNAKIRVDAEQDHND